jgi:hypothetical protein
MIHFRIQIPSVNLRSYARRFENTRQKRHYRSQKLEDTGCIALGALDLQSPNRKCYNFVTTPRWSDRDFPIKQTE